MNVDELWTGEFGNEYVSRNANADTGRVATWKLLLSSLPRLPESVLEVGANIGLNLEAIGRLIDCELYASEPNDLAREELIQSELMPERNVTGDFARKLRWPDEHVDLAITCGLLIHIPRDELVQSMKEIYRTSKRYIISGEYFAPHEEMIPYRGKPNALWRRDYGSIWMDNFPDLYCHASVFAWKRQTGLDNITFWVFEKGYRPN